MEYSFSGPFELLNQFRCDNTESQYACIIVDQFIPAIDQATHLTVGAALKAGLLKDKWAFGYRTINGNKSGGTDDSTESIYSYRTMLILRKYRIIPVGWELAA